MAAGTALDPASVNLRAIEAARDVIAPHVHRTPLLFSTAAASVVERASGHRLADGRVYLKAEHLQKTGSFKPRGMTNRVAALGPEERRRGIITVSAGNAAQGYAYAGAVFGVPVTVVMPAAANPMKAAAAAGYGARVVLEGGHVGETFAAKDRIAAEEGLTFCHPFDDADVVAGHGSVGLELLEDLPEVDVVVVGIGGGGLISGVATALKAKRRGVRVIGVEPTGSNALGQALATGAPVTIAPKSVADGLNAPFAGALTLELVRRLVDEVITIDDSVILAGLKFAMERTKQALEPAGAAALGALLAGAVDVRDGDRVAVILSGGNVDTSRLGEFLAAAAPLA